MFQIWRMCKFFSKLCNGPNLKSPVGIVICFAAGKEKSLVLTTSMLLLAFSPDIPLWGKMMMDIIFSLSPCLLFQLILRTS